MLSKNDLFVLHALRFRCYAKQQRYLVGFDSEKNLKKCTDWSKIDKKEYLTAMQESPVDSSHIYELIKSALTDDINNREIFMKGIDYSYYYEQVD